ncbi:MAG TPA: Gfo/Idh/MocA family oxidoreductase [Bryobacteraceae bacterium]|nr:Gfo/Idh/MocA family oxidoreductase [Bryobacteraceae bacterium]
MKHVKIGVIGAGWWAAENHIPVLQSFPGVEVAAVCRLGAQELRKVQERFHIPYGTEDYRDLIRVNGLDGVVISSPHHLHFEHARAALEHGLHVLCEKPMVLHAAEARQIASLAHSGSMHFLIPYGWSYTGFARAAKSRIDGGEIGAIEHVHCHMASALRDLFSGEGAWFAEKAFLQPQMGTWSNPDTGGGFAHGQLTHALGLLFYITALEPQEVFALIGNSATGADLFNSIACRFSSGATGMLGGAATMPPGSPYQVDIRIFGGHGMLLLDIERPRLEIRRNDGRHELLPMDHQPGAYECVAPLRTFVDLIRGGPSENRSSADIGERVVRVLDGAFRSARSRAVVRV